MLKAAKMAVYQLRASGLKNYKYNGAVRSEMLFYRLGNDAENAKARLALELKVRPEQIEILKGGKPQ